MAKKRMGEASRFSHAWKGAGGERGRDVLGNVGGISHKDEKAGFKSAPGKKRRSSYHVQRMKATEEGHRGGGRGGGGGHLRVCGEKEPSRVRERGQV